MRQAPAPPRPRSPAEWSITPWPRSRWKIRAPTCRQRRSHCGSELNGRRRQLPDPDNAGRNQRLDHALRPGCGALLLHVGHAERGRRSAPSRRYRKPAPTTPGHHHHLRRDPGLGETPGVIGRLQRQPQQAHWIRRPQLQPRHRSLHPTQPDPPARRINTYLYAANPINFIDPVGRHFENRGACGEQRRRGNRRTLFGLNARSGGLHTRLGAATGHWSKSGPKPLVNRAKCA